MRGLTFSRYFFKVFFIISIFAMSSCSSGGDNEEFKDTVAPTTPQNLKTSLISKTAVKLSWSPSTDNVGVSNYIIYQNNSVFKSVSTTTETINNIVPNTVYTFKVKAKDAAGNESGFSNEVTVKNEATTDIIESKSGNIETYISTIIDNAPGSSGDDYKAPSEVQLTHWNAIISFILQNKITDAFTKATTLGYKIVEFTDTSIDSKPIFYILEKTESGTNYWGTYVFTKNPSIDKLILMAPHSKYDTNTGKQAVYCFKNTLAKALFINGTHRCNSSESSSCSGTTSACGTKAAFKISDMAHTTSSVYQKTTENIFENVANSVFIQLHGFGKKSTDPYVIISNGTRKAPAITDYAVKIKDALLEEDSSLTFKIAHIDTDWTRLRGFTNTQGRLINLSSDPCGTSATTPSGRFIHIEQEKSKLRNNETGWKKMSNALKKVFK